MGLFEKLFKTGELPEIKTSVEIDQQSLIKIGLVIVISGVIVILFNKVVSQI